MQNRQPAQRRSSGAKALTIDKNVLAARYRIIYLTAIILSASFALGLHLVFGH